MTASHYIIEVVGANGWRCASFGDKFYATIAEACLARATIAKAHGAVDRTRIVKVTREVLEEVPHATQA